LGYQLPTVKKICLVKLCDEMLDSVSYDWGSLHMFDSLVLGRASE